MLSQETIDARKRYDKYAKRLIAVNIGCCVQDIHKPNVLLERGVNLTSAYSFEEVAKQILNGAANSGYWAINYRVLIATSQREIVLDGIRQLTQAIALKQHLELADCHEFMVGKDLEAISVVWSNQKLPVICYNPIFIKNPTSYKVRYGLVMDYRNDIDDYFCSPCYVDSDVTSLTESIPYACGVKQENGKYVPEDEHYFDHIVNLDDKVSNDTIKDLFDQMIKYQLCHVKKTRLGETAIEPLPISAMVDYNGLMHRNGDVEVEKNTVDQKEMNNFPKIMNYFGQYI